MSERTKRQKTRLETVEPLGKRVLIRKDDDKKVTKGGIELPDSVEIPTITGRIVAVSAQVENDDDFPLRQYDRVLFNPQRFRWNSKPIIASMWFRSRMSWPCFVQTDKRRCVWRRLPIP